MSLQLSNSAPLLSGLPLELGLPFLGSNQKPDIPFKYHVVYVTRELAERLLKNNSKNRKIILDHVARLAAHQSAGRFILSPHPVILDSDFSVRDGQHRLASIVKSGIPQLLIFAIYNRPMENSEWNVIDTGVPRTPAVWARIAGHTNAKMMCAAANVIISIVSPGGKARKDWPALDATLRLFEEAINTLKFNDVTAYGPFYGSCIFAYSAFPEAVKRFVDDVSTGADLHSKDPALKLRNYLSNTKRGGGSSDRFQDCLKVLTALKHRIDGTSISVLFAGEEGRNYFLKVQSDQVERIRQILN